MLLKSSLKPRRHVLLTIINQKVKIMIIDSKDLVKGMAERISNENGINVKVSFKGKTTSVSVNGVRFYTDDFGDPDWALTFLDGFEHALKMKKG